MSSLAADVKMAADLKKQSEEFAAKAAAMQKDVERKQKEMAVETEKEIKREEWKATGAAQHSAFAFVPDPKVREILMKVCTALECSETAIHELNNTVLYFTRSVDFVVADR
jgi:hypothetical protein